MSRRGAIWAAIAAGVLIAVARWHHWPTTQPRAPGLQSASLELPADAGALPAGPHRELVEANCTGCHSAEMLTTQPPLTPIQWAASVKKMREVYHAPVAAADDAAIVAYLAALSGRPGADGAVIDRLAKD